MDTPTPAVSSDVSIIFLCSREGARRACATNNVLDQPVDVVLLSMRWFATTADVHLSTMMRQMKMAQRQDPPDFLDFCTTVRRICHNTEAPLEAVNAFLDKRARTSKAAKLLFSELGRTWPGSL